MFLINAALLNVYFISYTTIYFFVKKFIFSNVYISVNAIFECLYIIFSCEKGHHLSIYATGEEMGRGEEGFIQNVHSYVQEEGVSCLMLTAFLSCSISFYL